MILAAHFFIYTALTDTPTHLNLRTHSPISTLMTMRNTSKIISIMVYLYLPRQRSTNILMAGQLISMGQAAVLSQPA